MTKIIEDKVYNDINKLSSKYVFLVEEFAGFIVEYKINHDQIMKSMLDEIKKYVIFDDTQEQKEIYESVIDSEDEDISDTDSEDEDISNIDSNDKIINCEIKESIIDIEMKEPIIDSEAKELTINDEDETKQSIIYEKKLVMF